jgi:hypothetical protein
LLEVCFEALPMHPCVTQTDPAVAQSAAAAGSWTPAQRSAVTASFLAWGHCQLKRPWYARRVSGGSSGRGTPLIAYYAAPLKPSGAGKGALSPLS